MKLLLTSIMTLAVILATPLTVFAAETPQISVPVSTIVRGDAGSTHILAEKAVDETLIGMECSVTATAENQGSVHPGNDLIISSGLESVTLANVEREANGLTNADGILTMSDDLTVNLVLGQDKVFSGGMTVKLHCEEPKEVKVCRNGTVITVKEADVLGTDTEAPCPVVEIEVCRDGEIITINEDERLETDTETCPVEEPKKIEVCRDGKIISIDETDKKDSDTAECPEVLSEVTEIPKTGAGSAFAFVAGSGVFGTIAHAFVTRRRI